MLEDEKVIAAKNLEELTNKLKDQEMKIEDQEFDERVTRNEMKELEEKFARVKGGEEEKKTNQLKRFDPKSTPKPGQYDCESKEFNTWHDLFTALLVNLDEKWEDIFEKIEGYSGRVIKEKEKGDIQKDLGFEDEMMEKLQRLLYLNLLTYTKGDAHSKVVSGGQDHIMETYRYIVHKGKNATVRVVLEKRTKVMNPEPAKDMADIEGKVTAWKNDIRYLEEIRDTQDIMMLKNDEQMITILITMMPDGRPHDLEVHKRPDDVRRDGGDHAGTTVKAGHEGREEKWKDKASHHREGRRGSRKGER